jgi:hypothetical protein
MAIECKPITTWAEFMAATPEQRRRWRDRLLREWEENGERELAEDERADGARRHWGD